MEQYQFVQIPLHYSFYLTTLHIKLLIIDGRNLHQEPPPSHQFVLHQPWLPKPK